MLPLSSFKLPPQVGLFEEDFERTFDGLYGVFSDSLLDGWGLLLMDRHLRKLGMDLRRITLLGHLAYIGTRGMGAFTYHLTDPRKKKLALNSTLAP